MISALQPPAPVNQHAAEPLDHLTTATVGADTPKSYTQLPEIPDVFKVHPPLIKYILHQVRQEVTRSFT